MNKKLNVRIDDETYELLEKLKKELKITKSDIIRMSVSKFSIYIDKVNK